MCLCVGGLEAGITGYVCVCSHRLLLRGLVTELGNSGGQPNGELMTGLGLDKRRCVSAAPKEFQPWGHFVLVYVFRCVDEDLWLILYFVFCACH